MWETAVGVVFGAILGTGGSLGVTWWFQRRASKELKSETVRLHDELIDRTNQLHWVVSLLAGAMHEAGVIEADFDKRGYLISFPRSIKASSIPSTMTLFGATVIGHAPQREDEDKDE